MAATYAACRSYSDSGAVTTTYGGHLGWTDRKPFKTAFIRPDRFRFQFDETFQGDERTYIVWRKGDDVRTWWDVRPGIEKARSLGNALSAATGVSGGSAHAIPALLLADEVGGRRLTDVSQAKRLDDAKIGTVECYRLQGSYGHSPISLWIEKGSFLVRRIELRMELSDGPVDETTTCDPVINGEVTDTMLAFHAPARR